MSRRVSALPQLEQKADSLFPLGVSGGNETGWGDPEKSGYQVPGGARVWAWAGTGRGGEWGLVAV